MLRSGLYCAAPAALALALGACGGGAEEAETAQIAPEPVVAPTASDPLEREYTLSDAQQERRDGFDEAAILDEFARLRGDVMSEAGDTPPSRDEMNWSMLDRDDDGELTAAEYAIWALPLVADGSTDAPEITGEQADRLADSFFYYDTDGDGLLSQREFTVARSGDLIS